MDKETFDAIKNDDSLSAEEKWDKIQDERFKDVKAQYNKVVSWFESQKLTIVGMNNNLILLKGRVTALERIGPEARHGLAARLTAVEKRVDVAWAGEQPDTAPEFEAEPLVDDSRTGMLARIRTLEKREKDTNNVLLLHRDDLNKLNDLHDLNLDDPPSDKAQAHMKLSDTAPELECPNTLTPSPETIKRLRRLHRTAPEGEGGQLNVAMPHIIIGNMQYGAINTLCDGIIEAEGKQGRYPDWPTVRDVVLRWLAEVQAAHAVSVLEGVRVKFAEACHGCDEVEGLNDDYVLFVDANTILDAKIDEQRPPAPQEASVKGEEDQ